MSPKRKGKLDKYMNFLRASSTSGVNSIVTKEVKTGCNVRLGLAMEIHMIEYIINLGITQGSQNVGFSSKDLADIDDVADMSLDRNYVISFAEHRANMTTSGAILEVYPKVIHFDPPIIYAEPSIWFNNWHSTAEQGATGRIGYTYVELTTAELIEVLESYR